MVTISWRYPAVELFCAGIFAFISWRLQSQPIYILAACLFFYFILFLIGAIDLATYFESGMDYGIIPDHLTYLLIGTGLLFAPLNPRFDGQWWWAPASGAIGCLFMWSVRAIGEAVFKKESLGLGDVKMIAAVGTWMGWSGISGTLILGSLLGTILSLILIASGRLKRTSAVPFGPFLAFGSLSALFF